MKKLACLGALLLILALAGCAGVTEGQGTATPLPGQYSNPSWGSDPTCSPGCPVGQGGPW